MNERFRKHLASCAMAFLLFSVTWLHGAELNRRNSKTMPPISPKYPAKVAHVIDLAQKTNDFNTSISQPAKKELEDLITGGDVTIYELLADPDVQVRITVYIAFHEMKPLHALAAASDLERKAMPILIKDIKDKVGQTDVIFSRVAECGMPGWIAICQMISDEDEAVHTGAVASIIQEKIPISGDLLQVINQQVPKLLEYFVGGTNPAARAESILKKVPISEEFIANVRKSIPQMPTPRFIEFVRGLSPRSSALDNLYFAAVGHWDEAQTMGMEYVPRTQRDWRGGLRSSDVDVRRGALLIFAGSELQEHEQPDEEVLTLLQQMDFSNDPKGEQAAARIVCRYEADFFEKWVNDALTSVSAESKRAMRLLQLASKAPPRAAALNAREGEGSLPAFTNLPDIRSAELYRIAFADPNERYLIGYMANVLDERNTSHVGPVLREYAFNVMRGENGGKDFMALQGELPVAPAGRTVAWSAPPAAVVPPAPIHASTDAVTALSGLAWSLTFIIPVIVGSWLRASFSLRPRVDGEIDLTSFPEMGQAGYFPPRPPVNRKAAAAPPAARLVSKNSSALTPPPVKPKPVVTPPMAQPLPLKAPLPKTNQMKPAASSSPRIVPVKRIAPLDAKGNAKPPESKNKPT